MRSFRQIDLVLNDGFSAAERKAVTMGSRSMLNYVERQLASDAFSAEFTRLNIYCSRLPVIESLERRKEPWLVGIKIHYDPGDFLSSTSNFQIACSEMVQRGVRAASFHTPMPVEKVVSAVAEFFDVGCVNQWIHAEKSWARIGVKSVVSCELRMDIFLLWQSIYRGNVLETKAVIATTKPREGLFHAVLGKLSVADHHVLFRSKAGVISSYDLQNRIFVDLQVLTNSAEP